MKEFAKKRITFTAIKVNEISNKMIEVMQQNYDSVGDLKFILTDLAKSSSLGNQAQVTKDFVAKASFILSKTLGSGTAAIKRTKALSDISKLDVGQCLS